MITKSLRVGLVLSGGGSIGAYHVGVIKYLAENSIKLDTIAGASIGALNGAIVASSPSLKDAADTLEVIWNSLGAKHPLKIDGSKALFDLKTLFLKILQSPGNVGLFQDSAIRKIVDQYIDLQKLQSGLPFYVSVYRSEGTVLDISKAILGSLYLIDTLSSEFIHVQTLDRMQQIDSILASAAIPLIFKSKKNERK